MISGDRSLGSGFAIGHSYFCNVPKDNHEKWFSGVIENEIKPLLEEYWSEDKDQVENAISELYE